MKPSKLFLIDSKNPRDEANQATILMQMLRGNNPFQLRTMLRPLADFRRVLASQLVRRCVDQLYPSTPLAALLTSREYAAQELGALYSLVASTSYYSILRQSSSFCLTCGDLVDLKSCNLCRDAFCLSCRDGNQCQPCSHEKTRQRVLTETDSLEAMFKDSLAPYHDPAEYATALADVRPAASEWWQPSQEKILHDHLQSISQQYAGSRFEQSDQALKGSFFQIAQVPPFEFLPSLEDFQRQVRHNSAILLKYGIIPMAQTLMPQSVNSDVFNSAFLDSTRYRKFKGCATLELLTSPSPVLESLEISNRAGFHHGVWILKAQDPKGLSAFYLGCNGDRSEDLPAGIAISIYSGYLDHSTSALTEQRIHPSDHPMDSCISFASGLSTIIRTGSGKFKMTNVGAIINEASADDVKKGRVNCKISRVAPVSREGANQTFILIIHACMNTIRMNVCLTPGMLGQVKVVCFTTRPVRPGEELLYKYSDDENYQKKAQGPMVNQLHAFNDPVRTCI